MSGLNNDIESEIIGESVDSDTLNKLTSPDVESAKPSEEQPAAPAVILKIGDDPVDENGNVVKPTVFDLFGEGVLPNQVPDLNAKIILVETGENTIADAKSALTSIKTNGAISQEDIKEINSIFPTYLNDDERLEYYTKTPTLTRYSTAVQTIGFKIATQEKEQEALTTDTFKLLKESVIKTRVYLKESFIDTVGPKKDKLSKLISYIEEKRKDTDVSGYHAMIYKSLENPLEEPAANPTRRVTALLENALAIVRKPTAFASLLNKMVFLHEEFDQDFVFKSLDNPDNLAEKDVKATLKELMEEVYSSDREKLLNLLDEIMASAIVYIDNCIFAIEDKDAVDTDKESEPLKILKRESQAVISVNTLIDSIGQFDKIMYELAFEFAKIIKSIP